jgi:hypothetical protein
LILNKDGSNKKLAHLTLNTGLADGNYSYKITAVARKDGYNDKSVEKTVSFAIGKATFNDFTITDNGPGTLTFGYSSSIT